LAFYFHTVNKVPSAFIWALSTVTMKTRNWLYFCLQVLKSGGTVKLFQNTAHHHLNPTEMKHHQICTSCFPNMQSTLSLWYS